MFRVTAQDGAQYDPRTKQTWVEITILDVNDNAPVFKEAPFQANITSFASVDSTILTVRMMSDLCSLEFRRIGLKPWPDVPKYTAETKQGKPCKRNVVAS